MDLFVVPTLAFNLLYGFIIVRLGRRELVWIGVNELNGGLDCTPDHRGLAVGSISPLSHSRSGSRLWLGRDATAITRDGHSGQTLAV